MWRRGSCCRDVRLISSSSAQMAASRSLNPSLAGTNGSRNPSSHHPCAASTAFTGAGFGSAKSAATSGCSATDRRRASASRPSRSSVWMRTCHFGQHAARDRAVRTGAHRREVLVVVAGRDRERRVVHEPAHPVERAAAFFDARDARVARERLQRLQFDVHAGAVRDVVDEHRQVGRVDDRLDVAADAVLRRPNVDGRRDEQPVGPQRREFARTGSREMRRARGQPDDDRQPGAASRSVANTASCSRASSSTPSPVVAPATKPAMPAAA